MFKQEQENKSRSQVEDQNKFQGEREEEVPGIIKFQAEVREYIHELEKFPWVAAFWRLQEKDRDIYIEDFSEEVKAAFEEDLQFLIEKSMVDICGAKNHEQRMLHASFLYTLIHSVHKLRFGEEFFPKIQQTAEKLISQLTIVLRPEGVPIEELTFIKDFDLGERVSDYFSYAAMYKNVKTLEDSEWLATYGNTATLTEMKVARMIHDRAQGLSKVFEYKMFDLLDRRCGGKWFKANCKAFDRIKEKLKQIAEENKRPAFNGLMDCLRCRASFTNIKNLQMAYYNLAKEYTIIRVKNKLNDQLSNLTINFVYEKLIVEMQLVHGEIHSELESHTLYEIARCIDIAETTSVIRHWGGYLSEGGIFYYSASRFIDTRPLKASYTFRRLYFLEDKADPQIKYRLIRSKEYGNYDVKGEEWCDDIQFESLKTQSIRINFSNNLISAATLTGTLHPLSETNENKLPKIAEFSKKDFITKVSGSFNKEGITSLSLECKQTNFQLKAGEAQPGDKTFETNIPDGYYIVGLGGKRSSVGLLSVYCWFGTLKEYFGADGVFYEVELVEGEMKGKGIRVDKESRYEGEFHNSVAEGEGSLYYHSGNYYRGNWVNGKMEGQGTMYWTDGNRYEGEWKNDTQEGFGRRYFNKDLAYEGTFKGGQSEDFALAKESEAQKEKEAKTN